MTIPRPVAVVLAAALLPILSGCSGSASAGSKETFCAALAKDRATYDLDHRIATQARTIGEGVSMAGGPISALQLADRSTSYLRTLARTSPAEIHDQLTYLADEAERFSTVVKQTRGAPSDSQLATFDGQHVLRDVYTVNQYVNRSCIQSQPLG